jgi:heterotetrameric sarcosine oxidase gamma subunit
VGNADSSRPIARSPIKPVPPVVVRAGWEVSGTRVAAALRLADLTALTKSRVRAQPGTLIADTLACAFGRTRRERDGSLVIGSGPDEWLVLSPAGTTAGIVADVDARTDEALFSVVDVTHTGVLLRLTGAQAGELLSRVCAIDLTDRVTPDGACFRSSVARVVCDVVRDDVVAERSYLLHGDRSSGQYLFDAILRVGSEFSLAVDGYPEKEI